MAVSGLPLDSPSGLYWAVLFQAAGEHANATTKEFVENAGLIKLVAGRIQRAARLFKRAARLLRSAPRVLNEALGVGPAVQVFGCAVVHISLFCVFSRILSTSSSTNKRAARLIH